MKNRWMGTAANPLEKFGIALMRIMVGAVFVMHGYQKLFVYKPAGTVAMFGKMGFPSAAAWAAMIAEFGCGSLLVLGLATRLAAIPIVVTMAVAVTQVHLAQGFFLPGFEYALTLGVCALALVFTGPGTPAIDNLLD